MPFFATSLRAAETQPFDANRFGASDKSAPVRAISQREFADAATMEIGFLSALRAWRNTLRGAGARRDYGFSPLGNEKLALSLGNVAPPSFGGAAGIAAKWRGLEIGSTAQPRSLDENLTRFDTLLTGEKTANLQSSNRPQLNWLRAQLSDSPRAQVEIMAARAQRDSVDAGQSWRAGDFQSARAKFDLPARWSLSGDWNRAQIERDAKATGAESTQEIEASAWGIAAAGPLAHPFGVANARASWRDVGQNYVAPTTENGAVGARNGEVEIVQDLAIGPLAGKLNFGAATQRRSEIESALAGEELAQNRARSAAQMRLALTPNLSLTGNGQWNSAVATRALTDQKELGVTEEEGATEIATPTQARELSRQLTGDVGAVWNFSKALSVAVSLGVSNQNSHSESGEVSTFGPQNDELRRALEVRRKSGASDLRVRFSQRARKIALANLSQSATPEGTSQSASSAPVSQWRIEAARPLLGSVRLKTIFDFASDAANDQSARRIEAQLQLARAARLDARYREGDLAPGLMSDEWSSIFAASGGAPKQWSARFGAGSAASGAGLGLSLEMVRSQGDLPDSYRVGLQFK